MGRNTCDICVRRREHDMRLKGTWGECIRPRSHNDGLHLFRNPQGTYFTWKDDDECDCCEPGDPNQCFNYGPISEDEANHLMRDN